MKNGSAAHFLALGALLVCLSSIQADVRLPALFSDNMVLQQGIRIPVWGWADNGEEVTVTFRGKAVKTTASDGQWMLRLPSQKAGGPETLKVEGKNSLTLNNVLVGEVWVCSGQSNMEWPLSRSWEPKDDIAASANPNLRLFLVPKLKANSPQNDVKASWKAASPDSTPSFSAVAYYFGRDLQKALGVPVGLIGTYWGGSPAEVWMSHEFLESRPGYQQSILDTYEAAVRRAQASPNGKLKPPTWKPAELYNGMIAPLVPFAIKGAIWYQGESNAGRAEQYRDLFADMIRNWRADWDQGDFTFLPVQLAPWDRNKKRSLEEITATPVESDWAELREAQLLATQTLPKVGMAVITDVGEKDDIHPTKKEPVGARLALAAQGIAYGKKIEYSGPIYRKMTVKDGKVVLSFDHARSGLQARGGELKGFAICGPDRNFKWADAWIEGNKVVVRNSTIPDPVAVRYGWSDYPVVNLFNKAGLPASPFRTDNFPLVSAGKR